MNWRKVGGAYTLDDERDLVARYNLDGADRFLLGQILGADDSMLAKMSPLGAEYLLKARSTKGIRASLQAWREYISLPVIADFTAIAGTAEALLWTKDWSLTPANYFIPGRTVKLSVYGKLTTAASTPGTLTLTLRYGTTTGGTSLGATAASPTFATSQTNITWRAEMMVQCRTQGSSGSVIAFGHWETTPATFTTTAGLKAGLLLPASAPAATTIDTTTAQGIQLGATLGSASDGMTTQLLAFESLN